jgi:hypothetical protein
MIITDQKINDTTPYTWSVHDRHRVRVGGVEDRLDGVDRAGPDVAEHDTECADHHGQANRFRAADCAKR